MKKQELHPRTVSINQTQKNHSKKERCRALEWLSKEFPQAFDNTLSIRPLKIGIMQDIFLHADKASAVGVSKSKLREAVVLYTRRLDYLACLKLRERRVDLYGNEIADVTETEAECACTKIKKRIEKGAKNARKVMAEKGAFSVSYNTQSNSHYAKNHSSSSSSSSVDYISDYPSRNSMMNNSPGATKQPVLIKHKTARQYDPDAVARLKEKLGLSRESEKNTATIE
jgi:ProP effector